MSRLPIAPNVEMKKQPPIAPPVFMPEYDMWSSSSFLDSSFLTDANLASRLSIIDLRRESKIEPPPGLDPSDTWTSTPEADLSFSTDVILPQSETILETSTPSISDASSTPSSESTPDLSSETDESILDEMMDEMNDDVIPELPLPSMELIAPHRRLNLPPSCFPNGCICGHQFEYRDAVYIHRRRNTRVTGLTIRPKVVPIAAKLRRIE